MRRRLGHRLVHREERQSRDGERCRAEISRALMDQGKTGSLVAVWHTSGDLELMGESCTGVYATEDSMSDSHDTTLGTSRRRVDKPFALRRHGVFLQKKHQLATPRTREVRTWIGNHSVEVVASKVEQSPPQSAR